MVASRNREKIVSILRSGALRRLGLSGFEQVFMCQQTDPRINAARSLRGQSILAPHGMVIFAFFAVGLYVRWHCSGEFLILGFGVWGLKVEWMVGGWAFLAGTFPPHLPHWTAGTHL